MDSEWLKTQFRLHPALTKADLAQSLGLGASAVSKILAGTRQIKAHEYVAMRRFFGMPADGAGAVARTAGAHAVLPPLLKDGAAGETAPDAWMMPSELLKGRARGTPDNIRIFPVQEAAMAPELTPGEQVLVDLSDVRPSPPGLFVVSDGLGHIIRRCAYVPHSAPPAVQMSSNNAQEAPYILPLEKAGIVGRIIARLAWL